MAECHVIGQINNEYFMGFSAREVARENNWTKDKAQRRVVK